MSKIYFAILWHYLWAIFYVKIHYLNIYYFDPKCQLYIYNNIYINKIVYFSINVIISGDDIQISNSGHKICHFKQYL